MAAAPANAKVDMSQVQYIEPSTANIKTDVTTTDDFGTTAMCLTETARPETPEHLKKFRRSTLYQPGKPYVHWGAADNQRDTSAVYGKVAVVSHDETAANALRPWPTTAISQWNQERKESIYATNQREPLGKSMQRGHVIPPGLGTERPFGVSDNVRTYEARSETKQLLFPPKGDAGRYADETPEMHAQYVLTHGRFHPGEQRSRNYKWETTGVDPKTAVFGKKNSTDNFGAGASVNPMLDPANWSEPIVSARLAAFKMAESEPLGKVHTRGAGPPPPATLEPGFRFGVPSRRPHQAPDGGAKACFTMPMTAEQFRDDGELGRSARRPGAPPPDATRTFGLPSVRRDLSAPQRRSVADHRSFGNEATTAQLIAPRAGAELGIQESHFLAAMAAEDMAAFYEAAGLALPEEVFRAVYAKAAEVDDRTDGLATLGTFQSVREYLESHAQ